MSDLLYILAHPLLKAIFLHLGELKSNATGMSAGSPERKEIERRICRLESYCLPEPSVQDQEESKPLLSVYGKVVIEKHSSRRRFTLTRRGRPAQYRIRVRSALEEKLANPKLTWKEMAGKFGFKDGLERSEDGSKIRIPAKLQLERHARVLKRLLLQEGILVRQGAPPSRRLAVSPQHYGPPAQVEPLAGRFQN